MRSRYGKDTLKEALELHNAFNGIFGEFTMNGAPLACRELVRLARRYNKLQEAACNYGLTPRQEACERNLEKEITEYAEAYGLKAVFQGDPRGFTVKLQTQDGKGPSNSWGNDGWGIGNS